MRSYDSSNSFMKVKNASLIFDKTPRTKVPLLPTPVQCPKMHSSTESKPQRSRLPSAILTQLPIISCPDLKVSTFLQTRHILNVLKILLDRRLENETWGCIPECTWKGSERWPGHAQPLPVRTSGELTNKWNSLSLSVKKSECLSTVCMDRHRAPCNVEGKWFTSPCTFEKWSMAMAVCIIPQPKHENKWWQWGIMM